MPGKDRFINYINLLILIGLLRCRIFRKIQKVTFFVITKQKLMISYFAWESKKAFLIKNSLFLAVVSPGFNNRTLFFGTSFINFRNSSTMTVAAGRDFFKGPGVSTFLRC